MRIGILTYHFANNYGAALQAYCLQNVLQEHGIETEFINYQSPLQKSNNSIFLTHSSIENVIKNIIRLPHYRARKKRITKFEEFRKKYLNITDEKFVNMDDVIDFAEKYFDSIIVGSDQVWNPSAPDFSTIYFEIAKAKVPVYAYAVSLGTAKEGELYRFENSILHFSDISVREEASIHILKKMNEEIEAKGVLDPTLLPEKELIEKITQNPGKPKRDYIACYYLGRRNALDFKRAVQKLAEKFDLEVYYINANYGLTSYGKNIINDCGPAEFLGYLKNAKLVCTNSFHATALSIRFNVPFFCFENSSKDTRKSDLLKRLGIMERLIENFDISSIEKYELPDIDFDERLNSYREISQGFINIIIKKSMMNDMAFI